MNKEPDPQERAELESLLGAMQEAGPPPRYRSAAGDASGIPPDVVEGYRLGEEIGHGGQGVVFRALQESTGREVALKLLREGPLADDRSRHRFEREIELVASLQHPNIITVYGAGRTADGRGWVAMELVEGESLRERLAKRTIPSQECFRILGQVAEALIAAHRHGVIHLDLKPANVLVNQKGEVRVVDFGLARSVVREVGTLSLEDLGGTPGFMAPEQVREGLSGCDIRTDIHALGALLFYLMTGKTPYRERGSAFSNLEAVASGDLCDLDVEIQSSATAPRHPRRRQDLLAICRMALSADPELRYRRVEDFAADLRALEDGGFVAARQGERKYRMQTAIRRLRPILLTLLAATGVTIVAVWVALAQRDLADLAEERFQQSQEIAEAFLLEIDPLLAHVPGSGPAREQIIRRGTEYLEQLLTSAPENPSLRLKAAHGFHAIARVQADIYTMSSGRLEEAFSSLDRFFEALPEAEALASLTFQEQEFAFVLGVQSRLLGARVARELGQKERRQVEMEAALASFQDGCPFDTIDALRAHSMVLEEWGRWLVDQGEVEQAKDFLQQSRVVLEDMLLTFAKEPSAMKNLERDLAVLVFHEAELLRDSGDATNAETLLLSFLKDGEARLEERPSLVAQRDVATAKDRLAGLAKAREDYPAALRWTEEARALHLEMVQSQPDHPSSWAGQINLTNRMGELHLAAGELPAAGTWFATFLQESESFVAGFPDFARAHRMLGVAHYKQFEWAKADARPTDAAASLERSLEVFQTMQESGLLSTADEGVPAALAQELADFKAAW